MAALLGSLVTDLQLGAFDAWWAQLVPAELHSLAVIPSSRLELGKAGSGVPLLLSRTDPTCTGLRGDVEPPP